MLKSLSRPIQCVFLEIQQNLCIFCSPYTRKGQLSRRRPVRIWLTHSLLSFPIAGERWIICIHLPLQCLWIAFTCVNDLPPHPQSKHLHLGINSLSYQLSAKGHQKSQGDDYVIYERKDYSALKPDAGINRRYFLVNSFANRRYQNRFCKFLIPKCHSSPTRNNIVIELYL